MGILDSLVASGETPTQQFRCTDFFADHPDLVPEVHACRAAGFSWKQIAAQISRDHQVRISSSGLSDYIGRSR